MLHCTSEMNLELFPVHFFFTWFLSVIGKLFFLPATYEFNWMAY